MKHVCIKKQNPIVFGLIIKVQIDVNWFNNHGNSYIFKMNDVTEIYSTMEC